MKIISGIWFGADVDIGIHQKLIIVKTIAVQSCPSSKLVLWQIGLDQ